MSGNMIERLGLDWCTQRLIGGSFLYGDKLMSIARITRDSVVCEHYKTGTIEKLPHDFFTGFKVFKYPALGYRKYGPGLAVWLSKRHSYQRGLRARCVNVELSPASNLLAAYSREMRAAFDVPPVLDLVFFPQYDTIDDLGKLYEGDTPCLVLNENVLIEPNVANANAEGYTVYFKQRPCATIDDKKYKLHWFSEAYEDALSPIFNRG